MAIVFAAPTHGETSTRKYTDRVHAKKAHEARHSDMTVAVDPTEEVFDTNVWHVT